ncbi:30S ribosomal protein S9 [Chloroflexota bacterium]
MAVQYYEGIGRRKECTARIRILSGSGQFIVNGKPAEEYFTRFGDMETLLAPIDAAGESLKNFDISVVAKGGGVSGQTGSIRLGIARALVKINPDWQPAMRQGGFLTRDARIKERKKPGLKRARKAPTYTKR